MKKINRRWFALVIVSVLITATNICKAQTEIKIPKDSLPGTIQDNLHKKYSDYHVNSITQNISKQPAIYSLEIQKKNRIIRLVYNIHGKVIEKEKSRIYMFDATEPIKKKQTLPNPSNDGHNHQH